MYIGTGDLYYGKGTGVYANTYGLWLPKYTTIKDWADNKAHKPDMDPSRDNESYKVNVPLGQPTDLSNYFFLPVTGCYEENDYIKEKEGHYWSCTAGTGKDGKPRAYFLKFGLNKDEKSGFAQLCFAPGEYGHFIWTKQ